MIGPLGLRGAGVQELPLADNGAGASVDDVAQAIGKVADYNAEASAIVCRPGSWTALLRQKTGLSGDDTPILASALGGPTQAVSRSIYGTPVLLSSRLDADETQGSSNATCSLYVGQFDRVLLVSRSPIQVEIDRSSAFTSDQTRIRATARLDLAVPDPGAIVRIKGCTDV